MFAYCLNDPVNYSDISGLFAAKLVVVPMYYGQTVFQTAKDTASSDDPKNNPPDHPDFESPKKGNQKKRNPNGNGWGWVDNKGNVWVWTPNMHGGEGWTIQQPNGGHSHAYPGGGTRHHTESIFEGGIISSFPAASLNAEDSFFPTYAPALIVGVLVFAACGAIVERCYGQGDYI